MKIYSLTLLTFLLLLGFFNARAGWYECYNFKGTIGGEPVTLSIQLVNSYLDSHKTKFTVSGVYKRDKVNEPIRLTGELDLDYKKAILYETSSYDAPASENTTATLEFDFSAATSVGFRRDLVSGTSQPVRLEQISKLRDFAAGDRMENIEILQSDSL